MNGALTQLEREVARILPRIRRLELLSVKDAAKYLKTSPKWVRANLPIIAQGPRSQRVRVVDVEAFLSKRTIWPSSFRKVAA